ncbi:hypothetical protein HX870_15095 [Pseudomonas gingeri]|nr:hypothetical protein [Pseudomonas gingeri]NWA25574.1 hypothetical protein [Pseudomonas gingeri]NWD68926.1 hypothetical protein [Pseudomonas gingeri]
MSGPQPQQESLQDQMASGGHHYARVKRFMTCPALGGEMTTNIDGIGF